MPRWTYLHLANNPGRVTEGVCYQMLVDPAANPITLDLKVNFPNEEIRVRGIVKLEGDTLTFRYVTGNLRGTTRPLDFEDNSLPGDGTRIRAMTLKKVK